MREEGQNAHSISFIAVVFNLSVKFKYSMSESCVFLGVENLYLGLESTS
jgi:hypothetical protein